MSIQTHRCGAESHEAVVPKMIGNNLLPSDGGCLEQAPALCTPSRRGHRHLTNNSSVRGPVLLRVLTTLL